MDFLEGFLLGPLWSDTEYETQKHIGFHLLLGALVSGIFAWLIFSADRLKFWLNFPSSAYVMILLFLFLLSPFAARLYYQYILPIKLLLLAAQLMKFAMIYLFSYKLLLPKYQLDSSDLPHRVMDEINLSIGTATEYFDQFGKSTGMLLGIVGGGLLVLAKIIMTVLVAIAVPIIILIVAKILQWLWDYLVQKYILREVGR